MAAILASYPSVASHWSAAWIWGLLRSRPETVHITCRQTRRAKRTFVTHTADLAPADRARREGIPATSLSRTILDTAVTSWSRTVRRRIQLADDLKVFDLRETHGSPLSFEEDRVRDDELLLAGIETTRVTGPRLDREPGKVVDSIRRHLARRARIK